MPRLCDIKTGASISVVEAIRKPTNECCVVGDDGTQFEILSIDDQVRGGGHSFVFRCNLTPGLGNVTPGDFVFDLEPNILLDDGNLLKLTEWRPCMKDLMILDETAAGIKRWIPFHSLERVGDDFRVYLGDPFSPDIKDIKQ
jgi:hypothetical protein